MSLQEAQNTGIRYIIVNLEDAQTADEVVPELVGTDVINIAEGKAKWTKKIVGYDDVFEELEYSENWELVS